MGLDVADILGEKAAGSKVLPYSISCPVCVFEYVYNNINSNLFFLSSEVLCHSRCTTPPAL